MSCSWCYIIPNRCVNLLVASLEANLHHFQPVRCYGLAIDRIKITDCARTARRWRIPMCPCLTLSGRASWLLEGQRVTYRHLCFCGSTSANALCIHVTHIHRLQPPRRSSPLVSGLCEVNPEPNLQSSFIRCCTKTIFYFCRVTISTKREDALWGTTAPFHVVSYCLMLLAFQWLDVVKPPIMLNVSHTNVPLYSSCFMDSQIFNSTYKLCGAETKGNGPFLKNRTLSWIFLELGTWDHLMRKCPSVAFSPRWDRKNMVEFP